MMTPLEARLTEELEALRQENKLLREKIDLLARRIFGAKSEQLDESQLMLLLQGGDEGAKKLRPPARIPPPWRLNWKNRSPLTAATRSAARVNRACRSIFRRWKPSWIRTKSKPIPPPGGAWARR